MNIWDEYYRTNRPHRISMPECLRDLICSCIGKDWSGQRILEFGCGDGANAGEVIGRGGSYHGIDISPFAVAVAQRVIPDGIFACADFTQGHPMGGDFDIVFDRASLCHTDRVSIQKAVSLAFGSLKKGGIYVGCDWFSMLHSEFKRGEIVDTFTRCNYPDGQFAGAGKVHFTSEHELAEIFQAWEPIIALERAMFRPMPGVFSQKILSCPWIGSEFEKTEYVSAWWDVIVRKPR